MIGGLNRHSDHDYDQSGYLKNEFIDFPNYSIFTGSFSGRRTHREQEIEYEH